MKRVKYVERESVWSQALNVVVALAVLVGATGMYRFNRLDAGDVVIADRDKTGTSQGRIEQDVPQTTPPAVLTAGGRFAAEREGHQLNFSSAMPPMSPQCF